MATTLAAVLRNLKKEHDAAFAGEWDESEAAWYAKAALQYLPGFYPYADPAWREQALQRAWAQLDEAWVLHRSTLEQHTDWAGYFAANLTMY